MAKFILETNDPVQRKKTLVEKDNPGGKIRTI